MIKIQKLLEDPVLIISIIRGIPSKIKIQLSKKVFGGKQMVIIGKVILDIRKNAKLVLGDNLLLRSRNRGYHGAISSEVKIMLDPYAYLEIGNQTRIYGATIHSSKSIIIGSRCLIASNVLIMDRNGHEAMFHKPEGRVNSIGKPDPIIIEDDVWIGTNSVILPGTIISKGSVVMANSVVKGSFKNKSLIAGVPSKIIKVFD